jgi:4-amino-4-deoxy-L-arabinose transferase-like glycosyltransferase
LLFVLMLALAYWLWIGLTQRSITGDEGISILAGQAVIQNGVPELPSGMLYRKGIVPSYLLAGSFALFGANDFSIFVPSLLLSLGSLVLVYVLARELLGRPALGVAAAIWLLLLQTQAFYATSPRMYAPLQFFTLLTVLAAWRGFVRGRPRARTVAFLALGGAVLSHAQSGALLVAIPLACVVARRMQRSEPGTAAPSRRPWDRRRVGLWVGGYLVLVAGWVWSGLIQQWDRFSPRIADAGGLDPRNFDLALDPWRAVALAGTLEATVPLGLALVPLVTMVLIRAWRNPSLQSNWGTVYLFVAFACCALASIVSIGRANPRFWVMPLPLYVLLLCHAVDQLRRELLGPRMHAAAAAFCGTLAIPLVASLAFGVGWYPRLFATGYGLPCRESSRACTLSVREAHEALLGVLDPADRVVATNPWVVRYYLGRVDAFLRERRIEVPPPAAGGRGAGEGAEAEESFAAFASPTDEYLGIELVDTLEELEELRASRERVWIIADSKFQTYSSLQTRRQVASWFEIFYRNEAITIFVHSGSDDGVPNPLPEE